MLSYSPRLLVGFLAGALFVAPGARPVGAAQLSAQENGDRRVEGVVLDQQGLPITGARVTLAAREGGLRRTAVSGPTERFEFEKLAAGLYDVRIEATGFEPQSMSVDLRTQSVASIEARLEPQRLVEEVIVTPTRTEQRLGNVPASVSVLTSERIAASPAVVADDVLRQVATFSLFRRTSSLASHPTSQGVSLRGIGPSGQSRTLVLLDGVPFNDPFGGWVYWTRVPLISVDRIEVSEDTTSSLYGNYAMGGVINIVTTRPARRTLEVRSQYGSLGTPKTDFFASDRWRDTLGIAVEGGVFNTDGYPIVASSERGPIDNNANVDYKNISVKLDYTPTDRINAFFRTGYFTEKRSNGKIGEINDTRWTTISGGVRLRLPDSSDLQANVFGDVEKFHSTFLAVTAPSATVAARSLVRLSTDQHVPTNGVGWTVQWSRAVGQFHVFSAGTDWRWVDGDSREDAYAAATPTVIIPPVTIQPLLTVQRVSGGTQQSLGAFVQDIFTPTANLTATLSARVDRWRNYSAHSLETTVATGLPTANDKAALPDKDDTVVSPRLAALYHLSDRVAAWGALSSGFRAPTLTELYRQFSVGAVLTRPNDQLGPERLVGSEAGVNVEARHVTAHVTWFDNRVKNPVSNVTIGTNLLQKQNLGRTRIWGIQSDIEYRPGAAWRFSAGYLYNRAKVREFAANPSLANACNGRADEACFLPQVPEHRASAQVAYSNPKYATVAVGLQFVGRQFDDDLNVRVVPAAALADAGYSASAFTDPGLPKYAVVDLMASRAVGRYLEAFVGVQNLFDKEYFVGTLPTTVGTPRLVSGGLRVRFAGQ